MANVPWPPGLPHPPLKASLKFAPPKVKARTEMDDGWIRQRRRFTSASRFIPHQWIWTIDQFKLFEVFYEESLYHGTAWTDLLIWNGEEYAEAACRFDEQEGYSVTLKGVEATVTARLEVDGYKRLTLAEAEVRWPLSFP